MEDNYQGNERRQFVRLGYISPVAYKVCRPEIVNKLLKGYTSNVSETGLMCTLKQTVNKDDLLWLSFDRSTLEICERLEKRCLIYQSGIIGKAAWVKQRSDGDYDVGVMFITREEQNLTHIYPQFYFLLQRMEKQHE